MKPFSALDEFFMKTSLRLSERFSGHTEPNPMVGAVVVRQGKILSRGYHRSFGDTHAERMALEGISAENSTLYVTLEPCCHFGKTPPCTDIIISKGVKRVVAAARDSNPLVNGRGFRILKQRGIEVEVGLFQEWARRLNRHYFNYMEKKRPYIALHAGISLDGKLSDCQNRSQWITSPELRRLSHSLRGDFSAILAGRGTVELDNPRLTLRDSFWQQKKIFRVILDTHNRLATHWNIFQEQDRFPLILFSSNQAKNQQPKTKNHFFVSPSPTGLDLHEVCRCLQELGIASVWVEGGGRVIDAFLHARLADEIFLFTAPKLIGGNSSGQLFSSGVIHVDQSILIEPSTSVQLKSGWFIRGKIGCSPD